MSAVSSRQKSRKVIWSMGALVFLLVGCQMPLLTGNGDRLMPDARIAIAQGAAQSGTFQSNDITVVYQYSRSAPGTLEIAGKVTFSTAMQENFTVVNYFYLGIYLADSSGTILGMRDLAGTGGVNFTGRGPTDVTFKKTLQVPAATAMMAFRYTGRAESDMRGSPTDFFSDPILR